jgi:hypothetical protein
LARGRVTGLGSLGGSGRRNGSNQTRWRLKGFEGLTTEALYGILSKVRNWFVSIGLKKAIFEISNSFSWKHK